MNALTFRQVCLAVAFLLASIASDGWGQVQGTLTLTNTGARRVTIPARVQTPRIERFFSPRDDCTGEIVNRIDAANREVLVQAYRFDSKRIAAALIRAKKERHVDVRVLLDKGHRAVGGDVAADLQAADIPTTTYAPPGGIDHNKVIVVDEATVITGSFNLTEHARANAENVEITHDDGAARYAADWWHCAVQGDAQAIARAAKAVKKAVKAAKARVAAAAEAEAAWKEVAEAEAKAEKEAAADAKSSDPTVAKWAAVGVQVTGAAELAARRAETTAKAAKEAWTEAAAAEEAWAEAETAWARAARKASEQEAAGTKTAEEYFEAVRSLFTKADAEATAADRAWAEAEAKAAAHKKAADDADAAVDKAEKAADAADAAIKQAAKRN